MDVFHHLFLCEGATIIPSKLSQISHLKKLHAASGQIDHHLVISIKPRNIDLLAKYLDEVSYPDSPSYGQHWSKKQVDTLVGNLEGAEHVRAWLEQQRIPILQATANDEYFLVSTSISHWETLLQTQFYVYYDSQHSIHIHRAADAYQIPLEIEEHIHTFFQVNDYAAMSHSLQPHHAVADQQHSTDVLPTLHSLPAIVPGFVTPSLLYAYYNISSPYGNHLNSQAVFESLNQVMSQQDLEAYQRSFNLTIQPIAYDYSGHIANNACRKSFDDCLEASADAQIIMAISQRTPTNLYYASAVSGEFPLSIIDILIVLANLTAVADGQAGGNTSGIPSVLSISYGAGPDKNIAESLASAFTVEAMKVGLQGDWGVAGLSAQTNAANCQYFAFFPADSPYVLAIGGTMGPEQATLAESSASNYPEEVVCSLPGSGITSGGGFSDLYARPAYQRQAIADYFATISQASGYNQSLVPIPGYNLTGRGFPDLALMANSYLIVLNDSFQPVSGTSASTPLMAGMIALVNAARKAANMSNLGWFQPALNASKNLSYVIHDITSGNNHCNEAIEYIPTKGYQGICCHQGYTAVKGWDPVTGWGSVDFVRLMEVFGPSNSSTSSNSNSNSGSSNGGRNETFYAIIITVVVLVSVGLVSSLVIIMYCIQRRRSAVGGASGSAAGSGGGSVSIGIGRKSGQGMAGREDEEMEENRASSAVL